MISLEFDHVGIIVKNLDFGIEQFNLFHKDLVWSETIEEPIQDVFIKFATDKSNIRYEIIAPNSEKSPVLLSLKKKINILNHLAYKVRDLKEAEKYFKNLKSIPITKASMSVAFNNSLIQFWLTPSGLIYELIENN